MDDVGAGGLVRTQRPEDGDAGGPGGGGGGHCGRRLAAAGGRAGAQAAGASLSHLFGAIEAAVADARAAGRADADTELLRRVSDLQAELLRVRSDAHQQGRAGPGDPSLTAREAELAARAAELAAREAGLAAREAELAEREAELDERATAVGAKDAEAERRLAKAKAAQRKMQQERDAYRRQGRTLATAAARRGSQGAPAQEDTPWHAPHRTRGTAGDDKENGAADDAQPPKATAAAEERGGCGGGGPASPPAPPAAPPAAPAFAAAAAAAASEGGEAKPSANARTGSDAGDDTDPAVPTQDSGGGAWQSRGDAGRAKRKGGSAAAKGGRQAKVPFGEWRRTDVEPDSPDFLQTAREAARAGTCAPGGGASPLEAPHQQQPAPWWRPEGAGWRTPEHHRGRTAEAPTDAADEATPAPQKSTPSGYWDWGFPDENPSQCTARPYGARRRSSNFGCES